MPVYSNICLRIIQKTKEALYLRQNFTTMRKISAIFVLIILSEVLLAGVRPVQIIRCGVRATAAKTTTVKAIASTEHLCSGLAVTAMLPDSCASGLVTMLINVPGDFQINDALTVTSITNMVFADGSHQIADTLNTMTTEALRPAFVADVANLVEIQFTRDLTQESVLVLRNANGGAGATFTIPACASATNATVPTMGEWGLMSLGLILLIFGINALRQSVSQRQIVE